MVQHDKDHPHTQKQQPPGQAGASPTPPQHQGPVGTPTESEVLGGTGSPTSGPTGEPMVKAAELPGQPKGPGEESAAGEVGETDIGGPQTTEKAATPGQAHKNKE